MKKAYCYNTDVGPIGIAADGGAVTNVFLAGIPVGLEIAETPLVQEAARQLEEYIAGERRTFELPLAADGTEFQQRVWQALLSIPYGETRSYRQVAETANCPKGYRAVGLANNRNPIPIFIPCHRVIGVSGELVGYGGGLDMKRRLLAIEGMR